MLQWPWDRSLSAGARCCARFPRNGFKQPRLPQRRSAIVGTNVRRDRPTATRPFRQNINFALRIQNRHLYILARFWQRRTPNTCFTVDAWPGVARAPAGAAPWTQKPRTIAQDVKGGCFRTSCSGGSVRRPITARPLYDTYEVGRPCAKRWRNRRKGLSFRMASAGFAWRRFPENRRHHCHRVRLEAMALRDAIALGDDDWEARFWRRIIGLHDVLARPTSSPTDLEHASSLISR